jgi:heat shock protein HslJ
MRHRCSAWLFVGVGWVLLVALPLLPALAAEANFPFDSELLLDVQPMKGSKRVPSLEIGPRGEASIDLWCNTVTAQVVVVDDTITIVTGERTNRQCTPDRMQGDEVVLDALQQATNWRRSGDVFILEGAKPMYFRLPTN